jgi:hypothetical protein
MDMMRIERASTFEVNCRSDPPDMLGSLFGLSRLYWDERGAGDMFFSTSIQAWKFAEG